MESYSTLSDVKARLSAYLDRVAEGDEIVVTRMGKPVARLVPYRQRAVGKRIGFAQGEVEIHDDFDDWGEEEARALGITD